MTSSCGHSARTASHWGNARLHSNKCHITWDILKTSVVVMPIPHLHMESTISGLSQPDDCRPLGNNWDVQVLSHTPQHGDIRSCAYMVGFVHFHYNDVMMSEMASQITSLTIVYSTVYLGADQRKHHWPLCGQFTGAPWIPRTNGQ